MKINGLVRYTIAFQGYIRSRICLLSRRVMRFVFALLAACALLLSVMNGAAANAAVSFEPTPVEMLTHQEGDGDEVPNCPLAAGGHHHHQTSGEHHGAVTIDAARLPDVSCGNEVSAISRDQYRPGLHPASEPHPPKA